MHLIHYPSCKSHYQCRLPLPDSTVHEDIQIFAPSFSSTGYTSSYSLTYRAPLVGLPPEMLERVYMYCTMGRLSLQEVRRLHPTGALLGMEGITDREIAHRAFEDRLIPADTLPHLTFPAGTLPYSRKWKGIHNFRTFPRRESWEMKKKRKTRLLDSGTSQLI